MLYGWKYFSSIDEYFLSQIITTFNIFFALLSQFCRKIEFATVEIFVTYLIKIVFLKRTQLITQHFYKIICVCYVQYNCFIFSVLISLIFVSDFTKKVHRYPTQTVVLKHLGQVTKPYLYVLVFTKYVHETYSYDQNFECCT